MGCSGAQDSGGLNKKFADMRLFTRRQEQRLPRLGVLRGLWSRPESLMWQISSLARWGALGCVCVCARKVGQLMGRCDYC